MSVSPGRPCHAHRCVHALLVLLAVALCGCASSSSRVHPGRAVVAGSLSTWDDAPFAAMERAVDADHLVLPPSEVVVDADGALLHAVATVMTAPGGLPRLRRTGGEGDDAELPLLHTQVRATMSGAVARVEIVQRYRNPGAAPVDATYVFPLPENSAVDAMRMTIGERELEAAIMERGAARETFEAAREAGYTAGLLEEQRPNVFSQSVANVEGGAEIEVVVSYVQDLTWDGGRYEWTFPLVVGERYGVDHRDQHLPVDQRVVPPVLGAGMRPGDVSIEVVAEAGVPIHSIAVPTHEVDLLARDDSSFALRLHASDALPNRDFVLRYEVGTPETRVALTSHHPGVGDTGYATLTLYPRFVDLDHEVGRREFVFVVDVSGSMQGEPLAQCKEALASALGRLRPVDTFNIVTFASSTRRLFDASVPASAHHVRQALDAVATMRAGGGTELGDGIREAFAREPVAGRSRNVFLMTDGKINNEAEILELTRSMMVEFDAAGVSARVFALGVGHSPNHHLTGDLPEVGRGIAVHVAPRESGAAAADRFFTVVDHAVLEDVTLDWGDLRVEATHPSRVPDLFASRPVVVHARYRVGDEAVSDTITVRGTLDGEPVALELEATLSGEPHGSSAERTLWARSAIAALESRLWRGIDRQVEQEIVTLGLEHQIVTPFTSFVAVDPTPRPAPTRELAPQPAAPSLAEPVPALTPAPAPAPDASHDAAASATAMGSGSSTVHTGTVGRIGGLVDKDPAAGRGSGTGLGKKSKAAFKVKVRVGAPIAADDTPVADEVLTAVRKVFKKKQGALRRCYERRVVAGEVADRSLVVRLTIQLDGSVRDPQVVSGGGDDALDGCVRRVVERMRFDAPGDGVLIVTVPLELEAKRTRDKARNDD